MKHAMVVRHEAIKSYLYEIKEAARYLKVYVAQWRIMMSENLQFFKLVLAPAVQDEIRKMESIHHH